LPEEILLTGFADDENGRLFVFDRSGNFKTAVTLGNYSAPDEIIFYKGQTWILDFVNSELLRVIGTALEQRVQLPAEMPRNVTKSFAWLGDHLYVSNFIPPVLAEYDSEGSLKGLISTPFSLIGGVATDGANLYLLAARENEPIAIHVASVESGHLEIHRSFGTQSVGIGGLAVDAQGTVYSVDDSHQRMVAFDSTGEKIRSFGTGILGQIGAVTVVGSDLWVADFDGSRILIYGLDGELKGVFDPPDLVQIVGGE